MKSREHYRASLHLPEGTGAKTFKMALEGFKGNGQAYMGENGISVRRAQALSEFQKDCQQLQVCGTSFTSSLSILGRPCLG